jgi:hypothetical protein
VSGSGAYVTVGVALSSVNHRVLTVTWFDGPGPFGVGLTRHTLREVDVAGVPCRSEMWGAHVPSPASGYVVVTVEADEGSPPAPSLAGSLFAFSNVASTSIGGPCCADSSNAGSGTSTINKTMFGTSRGDTLVNSVCTAWTGTAPGRPTPDPDNDPEMVPLTFDTMTSPNLQHFAGRSPGADVARPATSSRHLRWLQSGSRVWAIVGLVLFATEASTPPPDAGSPPPDSAVPESDAAPAVDSAVIVEDGPGETAALPDTAAPTADTAPPLDTAAPPPDAAPLPDTAPPRVTDAGPIPISEADGGGPLVDRLRVGCACDVGTAGGGGGAPAVVILLLVRLCRSAGRRRSRQSDVP